MGREAEEMLKKVLTAASYIAIGFALGIGLCKFCPGFLGWVMGGIL